MKHKTEEQSLSVLLKISEVLTDKILSAIISNIFTDSI